MKKIPIILTLALLLGLLAISFIAWAQNGFALPWHTIDSGGAISQGGSYSLAGAIGQPDAGSMSDGLYSLQGGFWASEPDLPPPGVRLFLPLVVRNATH